MLCSFFQKCSFPSITFSTILPLSLSLSLSLSLFFSFSFSLALPLSFALSLCVCVCLSDTFSCLLSMSRNCKVEQFDSRVVHSFFLSFFFLILFSFRFPNVVSFSLSVFLFLSFFLSFLLYFFSSSFFLLILSISHLLFLLLFLLFFFFRLCAGASGA
ncbi:unnamed protein product [Acanthosepion pharaonis]|uniref:Uncharacterized protein n=1 Tax=Acanthosepion pharaonis TaxID=158019 RepID=A0A812E7K1_ACAPH|nr:unnamed protein product [Sepia pharaonis]